MSYIPNLNEGILITVLGIVGIFRALDSFEKAGPMITMLYTLVFIFFLTALMGIEVMIEAIKYKKSLKKRMYFKKKIP